MITCGAIFVIVFIQFENELSLIIHTKRDALFSLHACTGAKGVQRTRRSLLRDGLNDGDDMRFSASSKVRKLLVCHPRWRWFR